MRKQLSLQIKDGKGDLNAAVQLKDILSTLENGKYLLSVEKALNVDDADYYRKRFFAGIDIVVRETTESKEHIKDEVTLKILKDIAKEGNDIEKLVNLDLVDQNKVFSLTWLTPLGWKEFYDRLKYWAYDKCNCYV